jgi:RNA polymerase sigma factor (sigma-70 family)
MKKNMNDLDLIKALKSSSCRGRAIKELYKEFPKIKVNICSSGGSRQEAEEVFNDALLLLIEKVQEDNFQLTSKLSSFLYGINRFLWMNELRKKKKSISLEWENTMILTHDSLEYDSEKEKKIQLIEKALGLITSKCKELFTLFYFKKERMAEIAKSLDFKSVNSAKTQKYKCMEQLNKVVSQQLKKA